MAKTRLGKAADFLEYRPKPSLSLDSTDFKDIKNLKIGEKCKLTVEAKVISLSKGDEYGDVDENSLARARFRITNAKECTNNCCDCR
jgi:hypothetical protein